ncbi:MAG: hypothetical protein ACXAB4_04960 [Candidatus Hodarchaeales archaeon]
MKGKKTYAKGQRDRIKGNRFMNTISLTSMRVEDVHEASPLDKTGEFFLEVDPEGLRTGKEMRVPQHGEIHIPLNKTFTPKQDFSLWLGFDEADSGEKTKTVKIRIFEQDKLRDDKIIDAKIPIVYGSGTKYEILRGAGLKVKLKITSSRTRF